MAEPRVAPGSRYPQRMDMPPLPEQEAPPSPAVPTQRPGDRSKGPLPSAAAPHRRRNWRLILVAVTGVLTTLCAGGSLTAYLLYDKATAPDLGTPIGAVRQYLNAYLSDRNDIRAAQFACNGKPDLPDVRAARDDIVRREKQFGVSIHVSADTIRVTTQTDHDADVSAHVVLATVVNGSSQRAVEQWTFHTHEDSGWRVCDGHEVT